MAEDPFTVALPVRFRDLDPMGHVNNAVYATYLEHARARYFRDVVGESLPSADTVLVHLSIDYRASIGSTVDEVTVAMWIPELGESSVPMRYEVRTDDGVAATAETVQVAYDRDADESKPLPDRWRSAIEADMDL
ncbi:MAG: thioesterase family protein [Halobacteriales archaeon]|nr:thioesterase family protein [Halobacteriales archaeon]